MERKTTHETKTMVGENERFWASDNNKENTLMINNPPMLMVSYNR